MSWSTSRLATLRFSGELPHMADVKLSAFREDIGLRWYLKPSHIKLSPELLGITIDDCLVEFICLTQMRLTAGRYNTGQFKSVMDMIRECMRQDSDLKAYAVNLMTTKKLPLASETYLELTERHALYGGETPPLIGEGSRFAKVFMDLVMNPSFWNTELDQKTTSSLLAISLRESPSPELTRTLIGDSPGSTAAWDALMQSSREAVESDDIVSLPPEILQWHLKASFNRPKRPDPPQHPRGRTSGYRRRDNEIRHTDSLLKDVGMREASGKKAVADAFSHLISLKRVRVICNQPYSTPEGFTQQFEDRFGITVRPRSSSSGSG